MKKKIVAILMTTVLLSIPMYGCGTETAANTETPTNTEVVTNTETVMVDETDSQVAMDTPKYVFLFIGDGMSYPQLQLTNYFKSASQSDGSKTVTVKDEEKKVLESKNELEMMNFEVAGSAQTYDSTSFAPDSASTATSIATGNKTWSGSINVSMDFTETYETIAEKLKAQKDYKIGVITSVNLNHATPAAFYAHQESRGSYYEIGQELIDSNFDYFAGGALLKPTGEEADQTDIYELATAAGYKVITTQQEAADLSAEDGKAIVISEQLADSDAMSYEVDRAEDEWALADYVEKGIDVLDNDNGFFMMVEGGKIDWACHANDAVSTIQDTIALDHAVAKAVAFYEEHPTETLIIATGDHETGGLTLGYAGTDYNTFLTNFENQKISYAKYDADYVATYKENQTDFATVMNDVTELFGLQLPSTEAGQLVMTEYEYNQLEAAYETTMSRTGEETESSQDEYIKYGSYEPLTVTITHILNNKSGINFSSYAHTGLPVEVLVKGAGAENFNGYYDNTDIFKKLSTLLDVQ